MKKSILNKKIRYTVISLSLIITIFCINLPSYARDGDYVVMTIEAFTLDNGFIMNPSVIEFIPEDNAGTLFDKAFGSDNINYGSGSGNYIDSIAFDTDFLSVNNEIDDALYEQDITPSTNVSKDGWLTELDFTRESRWFLIINNKIFNKEIVDYKPSAGDVVRLCFSVYGDGTDLAININNEQNIFTETDRDSLIRAMANYYSDSDFEMDEYVMLVVTDLRSEQEEISDALSFLNDIIDDVENAQGDFDEEEVEDDVDNESDFEITDSIDDNESIGSSENELLQTTKNTEISVNEENPDFNESNENSVNPALTTSPIENDLNSSSYQEYKNNIPKAGNAPTGVTSVIPQLIIFFAISGLAALAGIFIKKKRR